MRCLSSSSIDGATTHGSARGVTYDIGKGTVSIKDEDHGSINLWLDDIVEEGQNQKIEIQNPDKILGRAKGSRGKGLGKKDIALAYCLPKLDKVVFIVFHSVLSDEPDVPMFTLKVLSRFMGYNPPIQFNANKMMLLEKSTAMRIFGYGPGFWPSRAGYFLCYAAYVLAHEKKDTKDLAGYKRKNFLRYMGEMPYEYDAKKLKD